MSKEKSSGSSFFDIMATIAGGVLAVGTVAAVGAAAVSESERQAREKRAFMEKVNVRLRQLDEHFKTADEGNKQLIKDEVKRLVTVQSDYKTADFDELNRLFDEIIHATSVSVAVKAQEKRSAILNKQMQIPSPATAQTASWEEIHREIDRINERLSNWYITEDEKKQLLELRQRLYNKIY